MNKQLIFVYNANSDVKSVLRDGIKKLRTGKSECSLCTATWDAFNVKPSWKVKEKRLKIPFTYYHRDDLPIDLESYLNTNSIELPSVLIQEEGAYRELIPKEHLDNCEGNDDCIWNLLKAISPAVS